MNLQDATLIVLTEAAAYPELAGLAQSAYDDLAEGSEVSHEVLGDLIGKASEKGVLRALHQKYSPAACDAILMPLLAEVDRLRPIPPRRQSESHDRIDPLTAPLGTF